MRWGRGGLTLTLLWSALTLGAARQTVAPPATAVVEARTAQTIDGFGASGAWWPIDLAAFPPRAQRQAGAWLFGPPAAGGIALSVYRYNIGAGGVGVTNPSRAPLTFLDRPGHYTWTRDPGGLLFLRLARDYHVPVLVGFANSAPPPWTDNGQSCGGTLRTGAEEQYAGYLADVVRHLRQVEHITLRYVSPINEPDYTRSECSQEGMAVPAGRRAALIHAVARALRVAAPGTRVIADESSQVGSQLIAELPAWLSPGTARDLGALAYHGYDYPDGAALRRAAALAADLARPVPLHLWMTEVCCYNGSGFGQGYDPTIAGGLWLANDIWQSLTQAGDSSYQWWLALSSAVGCSMAADAGCAARPNDQGWNDGLISYDPDFPSNGDAALFRTKRFWVMGNFSRYVRPGAVRHAVLGSPAGVRLLAFAAGGRWVVVAIDDAPVEHGRTALRLRLPTPARGALHALVAVQTSATADLAPVALPAVGRDGGLRASLAPHSVTTFVVAGTDR